MGIEYVSLNNGKTNGAEGNSPSAPARFDAYTEVKNYYDKVKKDPSARVYSDTYKSVYGEYNKQKSQYYLKSCQDLLDEYNAQVKKFRGDQWKSGNEMIQSIQSAQKIKNKADILMGDISKNKDMFVQTYGQDVYDAVLGGFKDISQSTNNLLNYERDMTGVYKQFDSKEAYDRHVTLSKSPSADIQKQIDELNAQIEDARKKTGIDVSEAYNTYATEFNDFFPVKSDYDFDAAEKTLTELTSYLNNARKRELAEKYKIDVDSLSYSEMKKELESSARRNPEKYDYLKQYYDSMGESYWADRQAEEFVSGLSDEAKELYKQASEFLRMPHSTGDRHLPYVKRQIMEKTGIGEDELEDNLSLASRYFNAKNRKDTQTKIVSMVNEHPVLNSVLLNLPTPVMNLLGGISAASDQTLQTISNQVSGKDTPIDTNTSGQAIYNISNDIRSATRDKIAEIKQPSLPKALGGQKLGVFAYDTLMSGVDSLVSMGAGGIAGLSAGATGKALNHTVSAITGVIMGSNAAAGTVQDSLEKGYSNWQSLGRGFASGLAESLTEHIGTEVLLDAVIKGGGAGKAILKSALSEGTEEVANNVLNGAVDWVFNGHEGRVTSLYKKYLSEGYTKKTAMSKAWEDVIGEDAGTFLSAAITGAVFGASGTAANSVYESETVKQIQNSIDNQIGGAGQANFLRGIQSLMKEAEAAGTNEDADAIRTHAVNAISDRITWILDNADSVSKNSVMLRKLGEEKVNADAAKMRKNAETLTAVRDSIKNGTYDSDLADYLIDINDSSVASDALESSSGQKRIKKAAETYMKAYNGNVSAAMDALFNTQKMLNDSEKSLTAEKNNLSKSLASENAEAAKKSSDRIAEIDSELKNISLEKKNASDLMAYAQKTFAKDVKNMLGKSAPNVKMDYTMKKEEEAKYNRSTGQISVNPYAILLAQSQMDTNARSNAARVKVVHEAGHAAAQADASFVPQVYSVYRELRENGLVTDVDVNEANITETYRNAGVLNAYLNTPAVQKQISSLVNSGMSESAARDAMVQAYMQEEYVMNFLEYVEKSGGKVYERLLPEQKNVFVRAMQKIAELFRRIAAKIRGTDTSSAGKLENTAERILSAVREFAGDAVEDTAAQEAETVQGVSNTGDELNTDIKDRYSLAHVAPVTPTSDKWQRGHTEEWFVEQGFPLYRDVPEEQAAANEETNQDGRGGKHGTQITGTKTTYEQIFKTIQSEHPDDWQNMRILDASSGLGLGTRVGRNMGFNVTDIEPFPSEKDYMYDKEEDGSVNPRPGELHPDYTDYSMLQKMVKNGEIEGFDYIISNAVLNVIPQDTRDNLVDAMGSLLKPNGQMFVNVISRNYDGALKSKPEIQRNAKGVPTGSVRTSEGDYSTPGNNTGRGHETFVWKSNSVQKVFSYNELVSYLEDALGDGFVVEPYKKIGMTAALVTKKANDNLSLADSAYGKDDKSVYDAETLEEGGTVYSGEDIAAYSDGNGGFRFSLSTYERSGRDILKNYLSSQVSDSGITEKDAGDILSSMDEIFRICKEYDGKYDTFGKWSRAEVVIDEKTGRPVFSVIKPNGEYAMNLDFSLVCKKRRALDAVLNRLVETGKMGEFKFSQEEIVKINRIIKKYGFEIACDLCFVDAKRYRQAGVADSFVSIYNRLVRSMATDGREIDYFNFGGDSSLKSTDNGIDKLSDDSLDFSMIDKVMSSKGEKTVEYKVAKHLKENPSDRKLLSRGDFMSTNGFDAVKRDNPEILSLYNSKKGSGGPKAAFSDVQYLNDILSDRKFERDSAYDVGGVRIQSFSDYIPRLVFDYVQMVGDLAAKRLPAHAYTKEPLFAKQFGLTGVKINMSLIPAVGDGKYAGLNADGSYAWAKESFPVEEAFRIQSDSEYGKNVGTIAVGVSDQHIWKLLSDPNIRMVIPYHKSGINPVVAKMTKIDRYTNYTGSQNTRYSNGKKLSNSDQAEVPDFNKLMHRDGMDAVRASKYYVEWCEKHGYLPKFDKFAYVVNENGERVFNENYYKLLTDFTVMVDGNFYPQQDVKAVFPDDTSAFGSMADLIEEGLDKESVTQNRLNESIDTMVDEITRVLSSDDYETADGEERLSLASPVKEQIETQQFKRWFGDMTQNSEYINPTPDVKYSISPETDAEYMSAVERGDTETAQRMVDEAAKAAGYTVKAYHGTPSKFTVFDRNKQGSLNGLNLGSGFYFTDNERDAFEFGHGGRVIHSFLKMNNPIDALSETPQELLDTLTKKSGFSYEYASRSVENWIYEKNNEGGESATDVLIRIGYDSIVKYHDGRRKIDQWTEYVVFDSSQIKSADPITYDDSGNVIPLSERFDEKNDDIRYSLSNESDTIDKLKARIQDDNEFLRHQTGRTEKTKWKKALTPAAVDRLTAQLRKTWGIAKSDENRLRPMFGIADECFNGKISYDEAFDRMRAMAKEILSDVYELDDSYMKQNEDFIRYIKSMTFSVPSENESDLSGGYAEYRRENAKYIKLSRSGTPIDSVYEEICGLFPGMLDPEAANPADQVQEIVEAMRSMEPETVRVYSDVIRDASESLVADVMSKYERGARETYSAYRDRMEKQNVESERKRTAREYGRELNTTVTAYEARIARIEADAARASDEYAKLLDQSRLREREASWNTTRREMAARIRVHARALHSAAVSPTQKRFVPEAYRQNVDRIANWMRETANNTTGRTNSAYLSGGIREDIRALGGLFGEDFTDTANLLLDMADDAAAVNVEDTNSGSAVHVLRSVSQLGSMMRKMLADQNRAYLDGKRVNALDTGADIVEHLNKRKLAEKEFSNIETDQKGRIKTDSGYGLRNIFRNRFMLNAMSGYDFLHRLGGAGDKLYETLRESQSEQVMHVKEYTDYLSEKLIYDKKNNADGVKLSDYIGDKQKMISVQLSGGRNISMTAAQAMSIVTLYEREAGRSHIEQGGVRLIHPESRKVSAPIALMEEDIRSIRGKLDKNDLRVMNVMNAFIRDKCTAWGNEATMEKYGFKRFTTADYFPIFVDKNSLPANMSADQARNAVQFNVENVGFAKSAKDNASAPLLVDSFIDVINRHVEGMATYAAYLNSEDAVNRIMSAPGVRDAMQRSLGSNSVQFMQEVMSELKGAGRYTSISDSIAEWWKRGSGVYKSAAVSFNVSTAAKQPLSYVRAAAVISPKYLTRGMHLSTRGGEAHSQMMKYSGIGVKKNMGYSDVGVARNLGAQIGYEKENLKKAIQDFNELGMYGAAKMDEITWDALWIACREEVLEKNPGISLDTEKWMNATAKRFSRVIAQTQVVDSPLDSSRVMRSSNPFVRNIMAFQNEPLKGFNLMVNALDDLINAEKGSTAQKESGKAFAKSVSVNVIGNVLEAVVSCAFRALRDDDDDFTGAVKANFGAEMLSNSLGLLPGVSQLYDLIYDALHGYDYNDMGISVLTDMVGSVYDLVRTAENPDRKQETVFKQVRDLAESVATFCGVPLRNIDRMLVNAAKAFFHVTNLYAAEYTMQKIFYNPSSALARERHEFASLLVDAYEAGDVRSYEYIYNDMEKRGVKPKSIISSLAKHMGEETTDKDSLVKFQSGSDGWYLAMQSIFNRRIDDPRATEEEITRVYDATNNTALLPKFKDGTYSVTVYDENGKKNTENRSFTGEEYVSYLDEYGSLLYDIANAMRDLPEYRRGSDTEKAWWLTKAEVFAAAVSIYHRDGEYNYTNGGKWIAEYAGKRPVEVAKYIVQNLSKES